MKRRIGILTSGGDCPGLNAAIRGVARAAYEMFDAEIVGIHDGYRGLIEADYSEMTRSQFSGILTLGGNGTHKTANLLSEEGLNVIGLPKTIDNDLYGTDFTFGFHTANDIATEVIDRIHTTAASHGRVMVIEIMGNKAGWLTLYSGVAGGADVILIPEIPYNIDKVAEVVQRRAENNKGFTIIAVAEGAMDLEEAKMKKKDRETRRAETRFSSSAYVAKLLQDKVGVEARNVIPGHIQRGGTPSAYDRVLSTEFGVHAAELIRDGIFGVTVALRGNDITHNPLKFVAGVAKPVPVDHHMVKTAKNIGIVFGD